jgi:hypothetical protein
LVLHVGGHLTELSEALADHLVHSEAVGKYGGIPVGVSDGVGVLLDVTDELLVGGSLVESCGAAAHSRFTEN